MEAPTNAIERKEAFKEWSKNLKYGSDNWDENLWDQIDGLMGSGYKSTYSSIWSITNIVDIDNIWDKVPSKSTPGTPNYIKGNNSGAVKAKIAQYKEMLKSITAKGDAFMDDAPSASSPGAATGSSTASVAASDPTSSSSMDSLSEIAQKCKELLEANHNIILSGAPGTGKTYMAKQIALAMTGSEDRIGFVQFHPSYDYTDFVEGLRPTSASGSTIGFEHKDGIFKEFCEKALLDSNNNYLFIIDEINRGEMSKVFGELFFSIDPGYRGKSGAVRTQYANMVTKPNAFDTVLGKTNPKDFGHFFVPENVYIIGTMNDIDRSVDSMDFAMRRRFLIKDIKAEDTQKDMLTDGAVIARMDALNNVIEGKAEKKIKAKLGSSYSLGASYFQKYYKYNDFGKLWDYHLEGILREYLRGTQDPDSDLKVLKEAYENA